MIIKFTPKQEEAIKQANEKKLKMLEDERILYLLDPFNNQSIYYTEPLQALPDIREHLNKLTLDKIELSQEIEKLEEKKIALSEQIKKSNFGSYTLRLEEVFEKEIPNKEHFLLKLKIGGEIFVGLTDLNPEDYIKTLVSSAKDGEASKVSKKLRMYGYLHEYEIIKKLPNEIVGLIESQITIVSTQATLNQYDEMGYLEGNDFILLKEKNELNEDILIINVKALAPIHEQLTNLKLQLKNLTEPYKQLLEETEKLKSNLEHLEKVKFEQDTQDKNQKLKEDFFNQSIDEWRDLLKNSSTSRYGIDEVSNKLLLDIGYIIEIQYLASTDDYSWLDKRRKKLKALQDKKFRESFDIQLKKLNDELTYIENSYSQKIKKLSIIDTNFVNKVEAYNGSWFGLGKEKLEKLDRERKSLWNDANNKRQKELKSAFMNCSLINHGQYNKVIWSYNDLLKETGFFIKFNLSVAFF